MKEKILLFGILMILLIPNVQAYRNYCLDNHTLITEINMTKNESGTITTFGFTDVTVCPQGCEDNLTKYGADCVEPSYVNTITVIIGIAILFIFLGLIARGKR